VGSGLKGAGLDGVAVSDGDGVSLGVGDGAAEAVLVGVGAGVWLDGAVVVDGCGAGEVSLGLGDDGIQDGVGDGTLVGEVRWLRDGVGDAEGGSV
jgi:hypothetical protein